MNALELTQSEISEWSPLTQAIAKLQDAHFAVFNQMEVARSKRAREKLRKALGTICRAAQSIRPGFNYSAATLKAHSEQATRP